MLETQALQIRRPSQAQDPTKLSGSPFQLTLQMARELGDCFIETKPTFLKLIHIFTSSHSGEASFPATALICVVAIAVTEHQLQRS
jgi:hypothetical protein